MRLERLDDLDTMTMLLRQVVDSFEKLEIVVHLYRVRFRPTSALELTRRLYLTPNAVAEALAGLASSGLIRTSHQDDGVGWWLDPDSGWAISVEILVDLYETDRGELLAFMKHVATQDVCSRDARASVSFTFARRRRPPPAN